MVLRADEADLKITGLPGGNLGQALAPFASNRDSGLLIGSSDFGNSGGSVSVFHSRTLAKALNVNDGFIDAYLSHDFRWEGMPLSRFGSSLASADFSGDGTTDFIFGAPGMKADSGAAYYFVGKPLPLEESVIDEAPIGTASKPVPEEALSEEVKPDEPVTPEITEEAPAETQPAPEFTLGIEQIEEALKEAAPEEFALDITAPEMPAIDCPGFISGIPASLSSAVCSWSDTAGASKGVYRYCVDTENACAPFTLAPDRVAEIGALTSSHTYLRVQTEDLGGTSDIASFDLSLNHAPLYIEGPSDGGSDVMNPTVEGGTVTFSATANDPEKGSLLFIGLQNERFAGL